MQAQELIDALSRIQFSQTLSIETYILIAIASGFSGFFASYLKEKGKNHASKEDFELLKNQLQQNTKLVEEIKSSISERTWISQQVWIKKQEAYESIFELLIHVNKYVSRKVDDFDEWEYINTYHSYLQSYEDNDSLRREFKKDKDEYNCKINSPEYKISAEELKKKYDSAIEGLLNIVEAKAIYLNADVGVLIEKLKLELATTDDEEDWDSHVQRQSTATKSSISKIKDISKKELKLNN